MSIPDLPPAPLKWENQPSTATPFDAEVLNPWGEQIRAIGQAARNYAETARQAATDAQAPTDQTMANTIATEDSLTRAELDTRYALAGTTTATSPDATAANTEGAALFGPVWARFGGGHRKRISRHGHDYTFWQQTRGPAWASWTLASESANPGNYTAHRLRGCHLHMAMTTTNSHHASITRTGTWASLSNEAAHGGNYYWSSTPGATATWATPPATALAARVVKTTNGGLAKVTIDGSATAATMLPTAQQLVNAGLYASTILAANGGTLAPTDRVLDCYSPQTTGENPTQWDMKVPIADGLTNTTHTVVFTVTGYTQTGTAGGRLFYSGMGHSSPDADDLWPWLPLNDEHASAWEFAIERVPDGATSPEWVGSTHGYESQTSLTVFIDGETVELDDGDILEADLTLSLVRESQGLHPSTGSQVHERFTTTYQVDGRGLQVTVNVSANSTSQVRKAYTMLPVSGVNKTGGPGFDRAATTTRPAPLPLTGAGDQFVATSRAAAAWVWPAAGRVAAAMYVPDIYGFTEGWAHPGQVAMSVQDRNGQLTKIYCTWIWDADGVEVPAGSVKRWTTRYVVGYFPGGTDSAFEN